jgi:predicted AlkP superfamily phosphohydrolase/phosphomutase/tetratricopeptide (TPR) repeat protein
MSERLAKKVLLVGWDAADWVILDDLLARGLIPAFKSLIDRGVRGKIATLQPILSPMLWNSIATGKMPDRHGIFDFVEPLPDASGIRTVSSTSRKCKAIWNILSQNGMKSNVVNWFASYPAEPIDGCVITDRYCMQSTLRPKVRGYREGMIHPDRLSQPLIDKIVEPSLLGEVITSFVPRAAEIDQSKDDRLEKLAKLIAKMSTIQAAAMHTMISEPWDFMTVYFDAIDHFGHTFMPYHPPAVEGVNPKDAELYGQCVTGAYRFQDMMLGAMMQAAGDDTTIILVSDHGFHSQGLRPGTDGYEDPVSWHRPFGVAAAAGPGIKQNDKLYGATLLDVTPTILALLGLPIGSDMEGRPWLEIFDRPVTAEKLISWETYEQGDPGMHPDEVRQDPAAEAEAIRQLVELGYVEAPGEDAEKTVQRTLRSQKLYRATSLGYGPRKDEAIEAWRELIEQCDKDEDAEFREHCRIELALIFAHLGRYKECKKLLDELPEKRLERPLGQMLYAQICVSEGKPAKALEYLGRAGEISQNPQGLTTVGSAMFSLGRFDEADDAFTRALVIDEERAYAWQGRAQVALKRKEYEQAIDFALTAVGLTHRLAIAHYVLGVALARLERPDEAILALETAINVAPGMRRAKRLLATLYRQTGRDRDSAWKQDLATSSLSGHQLEIDD